LANLSLGFPARAGPLAKLQCHLRPWVFWLKNDGSTISERLLAETFSELREKFGAASWETQTLQGQWEHEGLIYRDNLTRFFVDVPDLPERRVFSKRSRRN
jgi:hypothetical protein